MFSTWYKNITFEIYNFKIWVSCDKNSWFCELAKLSYFTCKNGIRIAWSRRHVISTRDIGLCGSDFSISSSSSTIISSSEILDKLAKLFDSESLEILLTSRFLKQPEQKNYVTTQRNNFGFSLLTIFEGKIAQLCARKINNFYRRHLKFWNCAFQARTSKFWVTVRLILKSVAPISST